MPYLVPGEDSRCGTCQKPLPRNFFGAVLGFGGLHSPWAFCSPKCRDQQDAIWQEWYTPERR